MFLNRRPIETELVQVEEQYDKLKFPDAVRCIQCVKWYWNNSPYSEKRQYENRITSILGV